ncbi:MAG: hypothetical protein M4579_005998 [Chaenotheca gracillima]|nr:MAG: hypothetical protein M4579_005998 [Chaenotheca gracillima]
MGFVLLRQIFSRELGVNKFPTFCAVLIGGFSFAQKPVDGLFSSLLGPSHTRLSSIRRKRLATFVSALLAAWTAFTLLTREQIPEKDDGPNHASQLDTRTTSQKLKPSKTQKSILAGRTIDLTLFAVTRAADIVVGRLWSKRKSRRITTGKWTNVDSFIGGKTDAAVFAVSAGMIMWTWFYNPDSLPRTYNKWIREAAQVDDRLVEALRRARHGQFVYGKETGQSPLLQSMCKDYDWPLEWGNPAQVIPIPCEMVHMGVGKSCEMHVASRFVKAFKFALTMYLPVSLLMRARSPSAEGFQRAFKNAIRSSAFLGTFISLFYYSVCLSRTRLGPKIFGPETVSPQMWDSGLDVGAGCATCGWSILLEAEPRRHELAFFVAPRAAATFFPRRYDPKYQWRETLAFTLSAAVILTGAQENSRHVRGVFGRLLQQVLGTS